MTVKLTRVDSITSALDKVSGIDVFARKVSGITCRFYREYQTSIADYLRISPTIVWVLAGQTENDVFSNLTWNVD